MSTSVFKEIKTMTKTSAGKSMSYSEEGQKYYVRNELFSAMTYFKPPYHTSVKTSCINFISVSM